MSTSHTPSGNEESALAPLQADLRSILKSGGVPLTPDRAPEGLLALDGVTARSVRPSDRMARVDALDRLLQTEIKRLGRADLRSPAAALFGMRRGHGNLTERRSRAAARLHVHPEHFRKRIEPKILKQLAWQLYQDSLQYVQRQHDNLPFTSSGDTPTIETEHIEHPDTAEREAMTSDVWSRVYALRASLIRREATAGDPDRSTDNERHAKAARQKLGELLLALDAFLKAYGDEIFQGSAAHNAEGLIRLAGWTGELTAEEARELRWEQSRPEARSR
jgi:hypothetical protein